MPLHIPTYDGDLQCDPNYANYDLFDIESIISAEPKAILGSPE